MSTTLGLRRDQQRRDDGLSSSLQVSKAAEHLVCAELLMRGWNAFLADAGLPYDVVVDIGGGRICRVQVKSTTRMYEHADGLPHYRFAIRRARTGTRAVAADSCDYLAFVALDRRLIGFLAVANVRTRTGRAKSLMEFKTRAYNYERRPGARGKHPAIVGKFIEDFTAFSPEGGTPFRLPWA